MAADRFPVLVGLCTKPLPGQPKTVPWALVAPHEAQARRNHDQTLRRLAERGGLSPDELVAVLEDRRWERMDRAAAVARLNELVQQFEAQPERPTAPAK